MIIYKAYKFRMYPNNEQKSKLNSFMGTSRFIYNYFLNAKMNKYKNNKENYFLNDMKKNLKGIYADYPWLKEVDSCSLRCAIFNLEDAYKNFFTKRSGY